MTSLEVLKVKQSKNVIPAIYPPTEYETDKKSGTKSEKKRAYTAQERIKIAEYYQDFFNANRVVVYNYLKSFGVEAMVDIEFVADNGELVEIKKQNSKTGGKTGVGKIPTAVFVVNRNKSGTGEKPRIYIGLDFFIEHKMPDKKALWVLLHELTHFKDYKVDPKAYMENFSRMAPIAQATAERVGNEYSKMTGKKLGESRKKTVAKNVERTLTSVYSNLVEDISVNHHIERLSWYKRGVGQNELDAMELYQALFKDVDLSLAPEAFQYLYAMIISEFRGRANEGKTEVDEIGSSTRVTEGAFAALSKEFVLKDGKTYNTADIINAALNPNNTETVEGQSKSNLLKQTSRHELMDRTFLPTFLDLYVKDILRSLEASDEQKKEGENGENGDEGNGGEKGENGEGELGDLDDFIEQIEEVSPDFIDKEDMDEIFEEMEKANQAEKGKKDGTKADEGKKRDVKAEQKASENKAKEEWLKSNGFTAADATSVEEVESSIRELITPLREAWQKIRLNRQEIFRKVYQGSSFHGRFKISHFIKNFGKIVNGDYANVKLFQKPGFEIEHVETPEQIEIQLMFDYSGSQFSEGNYEGKQLAMKQIFMMIMKSVSEFNESARTMHEDINLKADVGVINFGTEAREIIPFGQTDTQAEINILNFFAAAAEDMGGTQNDNALQLSLDSLGEGKKTLIKEKKLLRMAILITDGGGGESVEQLEQLKREYKEKGIYLVAFHIGGEMLSIFKGKWDTRKNSKTQDGVVVTRIQDLPDQISTYILNILNRVV